MVADDNRALVNTLAPGPNWHQRVRTEMRTWFCHAIVVPAKSVAGEPVRTLDNRLEGDITIVEETIIRGTVIGVVTVSMNIKAYVHGTVLGDIRVRPRGRVWIHGMVLGDVINE